jgi:hypothetical protein
MSLDAAARQRALGWLVSVQQPDGGWGYRATGASYVEPTVLAALALARTLADAPARASAQRAVDWLLTTQRVDGSWGVTADTDPQSWATAYATLALARLGTALGSPKLTESLRRGADALLALPTLAVTEADVSVTRLAIGADARISGWAWHRDDASWVFPTAIALISAGALGLSDHPRAGQGVAYLLDRACAGGGWNIGSPYNFAQPVDPNPIDTAVALLALRSRGVADSQAAIAGTQVLAGLIGRASSPLSLAWGLLGLGACGRQLEAALTRLTGLQSAAGHWRENVVATSVALLATDPKPPEWWL